MKLTLSLPRLPFSFGALMARRGRDRFKPPSRLDRLLERLPKPPLPGAFPAAVLLVVGFVIGIGLWLWLNAADTEGDHAAEAPIVTVPITGGVPLAKLPESKPPDHKSPEHKAGEHKTAEAKIAEVAAQAHGEPPPPKPPAAPELPPGPGGPGPDEAFPLAKAPALGLTEESRNGLLPAIAPDGRLPWQVYARPFKPGADKRARVALVIGQMGVAGAATGLALQRLPPGVTLSFVPVAERLEGWVEAARNQGHEAMLSVPMEPLTYPHDDPGPNTLLLTLDTPHNLDRLTMALGRFSGYIGITSPSGTRYGADPSAMRGVLEVVKKRGLMFLDARTAPTSVGEGVAIELGVPRAHVDRLIDRDPSRGAIDGELRALEAIALKDGVAVGMGEPYPTTLERVSKWIPLLPDKGLVLVPLSAVVNLQKPPEPAAAPEKHEAHGH